MRRRLLASAVALATIVTTSAVTASTCLDYAQYKHIIGEFDDGTWVRSVSLVGDLAVVSTQDLVFVDLSVPSEPVEVSRVPGLNAGRSIVIGDLAYVACGSEGLRIVDVSDPTQPTLVLTYVTSGTSVVDLAVSGSILCMAVTSGVAVVDISNPIAPSFLSYWEADSPSVYSVEYDAPTCYYGYSQGKTRIQAVDLSDPTQPAVHSTISLLGASYLEDHVYDLALHGSHLLIGRGLGGLRSFQILEVSNPNAMGLTATISLPAETREIAMDGDFAYAVFRDTSVAGVACIEVGLDGSATLVSTAHTLDISQGIAVSGDIAAVADANAGLQVFHASSLAAPPPSTTVQPGALCGPTAVEGNLALMSEVGGLLRILDVTDPSAPQDLGAMQFTENVRGVAIAGSVALVSVGAQGLKVVSLEDTSAPFVVGSCLTGATLGPVVTAADTAYVCNQSGQALTLVEFSDPAVPTVLAEQAVAGGPRGLVLHQQTALVALYEGQLVAIDVSDASSPLNRGSISVGTQLYGVDISGDVACVVDRHRGLVLVDVSDPTGLVEVGVHGILGLAHAVVAQGDHVYLEDCIWTGPSVIEVINIEDPTRPRHVGDVGLPVIGRQFATTDDLFLIGTSGDGLRVLGAACAEREVENAQFSLGNAGFETDYVHVPEDASSPGTYSVVEDARISHSLWTGVEHTSGDGLFLAVNGDQSGGVVWRQQVTVTPWTHYELAFWLCSLYEQNPATVEVSINGLVVGSAAAPAETHRWAPWNFEWYTADATTATIELRETSNQFHGNDFGLDDFQFTSGGLSPVVSVIAPAPQDGHRRLGTPGPLTVRWDYLGAAEPASWELAISYVGGGIPHPLKLEAQPGGFTREWTVDLPPASSARGRLLVRALDTNGAVLAEGMSRQDIVLENTNGVFFDAPYQPDGQPGADPVREVGIVAAWGPVVGAPGYDVLLTLEPSSRCEASIARTWNSNASMDPVTDSPFPWWEFPSGVLSQLPVGRYHLKVRPSNAWDWSNPILDRELVLCRLGDFWPSDTTLQPVVLVHGWTSDEHVWYRDGVSNLMDALKGGGGQYTERHPWTFAYPNTDHVETSAAALGDALSYVTSLSSFGKVDVIAHSMGGLVTRCYLQSEALRPDGFGDYGSFRDDVRRVVTLGTPHLGEVGAHIAARAKEAKLACFELNTSPSVDDVDNNGTLIPALAQIALPAGVDYLFTAGTFPNSEVTDWVLEEQTECGYNDGVVSGHSATARFYSTGATDYVEPVWDLANIHIRSYDLGHGEMARPGGSVDEGARQDESDQLLTDVISFLDAGSLTPAHPAAPSCDDYTVSQFQVAGSTPAYIQKGERVRIKTDTAQPLPSARISLGTIFDGPDDPGATYVTDAEGQRSLRLPAGTHQITFSAPGYLERTDQIRIPQSADVIQWGLTLERDPAFVGPRNGWFRVGSGAEAVSDSQVVLYLGCEDASEMQVAAEPSFTDAPWRPLESSLAWNLGEGEGLKAVYVRFRSPNGVVTPTLGTIVRLEHASYGSVAVSSNPVGMTVTVDGRTTGLVTPTTVDSLAAGYHQVSLRCPGYSSNPALVSVLVSEGATGSAHFELTAVPPPPPVDPATLGPSRLLSGLPFQWEVPTGWDPAEPLLYDVSVTSDAAGDTLLFSRLAVAETKVPLTAELPDSQAYFIRLASQDVHGVAQSAQAEPYRFRLDQTPPEVMLLAPAAGDTLAAASPVELATTLEEWGEVAEMTATVAAEGGTASPDTLFVGAWDGIVSGQTPAYALEKTCVVIVAVADSAGNVGLAATEPGVVVHDGVTAAPGSSFGSRFGLELASGNPSPSIVRLELRAPRSGPARVDVFDVRGRRVRVLWDGPLGSGERTLVWDGRDAGGQLVASGTYLVRAQQGGESQVRKVVVVR